MFLEELGVERSGLDRLIQCSYELLGLISFLTYGKDECRAWTIKKARSPAGRRKDPFRHRAGFIRAETINFDEMIACGGSVAAAKEKGLLRSEGKEYVVQDGDMIYYGGRRGAAEESGDSGASAGAAGVDCIPLQWRKPGGHGLCPAGPHRHQLWPFPFPAAFFGPFAERRAEARSSALISRYTSSIDSHQNESYPARDPDVPEIAHGEVFPAKDALIVQHYTQSDADDGRQKGQHGPDPGPRRTKKKITSAMASRNRAGDWQHRIYPKVWFIAGTCSLEHILACRGPCSGPFAGRHMAVFHHEIAPQPHLAHGAVGHEALIGV